MQRVFRRGKNIKKKKKCIAKGNETKNWNANRRNADCRTLVSPSAYWRTLLLLRLHEFLSSFTSGYSSRKLQQKYLPHSHTHTHPQRRHTYDICMQILSRWFCICLSTKCHGAYAWCAEATLLILSFRFIFISPTTFSCIGMLPLHISILNPGQTARPWGHWWLPVFMSRIKMANLWQSLSYFQVCLYAASPVKNSRWENGENYSGGRS